MYNICAVKGDINIAVPVHEIKGDLLFHQNRFSAEHACTLRYLSYSSSDARIATQSILWRPPNPIIINMLRQTFATTPSHKVTDVKER